MLEALLYSPHLGLIAVSEGYEEDVWRLSTWYYDEMSCLAREMVKYRLPINEGCKQLKHTP